MQLEGAATPLKIDPANEQKASVVRLVLTPTQAAEFWPFLQRSQEETQVKGLLCTINTARRFSSDGNLLLGLPGVHHGSTQLELQIASLDRATTVKIQELIQRSRHEVPRE